MLLCQLFFCLLFDSLLLVIFDRPMILFFLLFIMAVRLVEFSNGGYKIRKIFTYESTYSEEILNFENWVNGEVPKFDFQSQFSISKIIRISLDFFSLKNINFGVQFWLLTIFRSLYFLKLCPRFYTSPLTQFSKFNNFL